MQYHGMVKFEALQTPNMSEMIYIITLVKSSRLPLLLEPTTPEFIVVKSSIQFYEGNPFDLHYPLLLRLGRAQPLYYSLYNVHSPEAYLPKLLQMHLDTLREQWDAGRVAIEHAKPQSSMCAGPICPFELT